MNSRYFKTIAAIFFAILTLGCIGPAAHADLIGHWKLDEGSGTTAADSSTFGNDATLTGAQNWVPGVAGGAFDFPGGGGTRFNATLGAELPTGAAARTITAWINPDNASQDRKFVGYGTAGSGNAFNFTVESSGVRFRHGGGNITYGGGSVPTNDWTHVAIRVPDGASLTGDVDVFLNGIEALVTGTGGGGAGVVLNTPVSDFIIGNNFQNNSFDGSVDDVQFYNTALSDEQIALLFANPGLSLDEIVPEPASIAIWSLLGLALTGLAYYRIRRAK